MNRLRELRIRLGLTQEAVAQRAVQTGKVRSTFNGIAVRRTELPNPIGLRSYELRVGLALGLGLSLDDLNSFLDGKLTVDEALGRSSVEPDPETVQKLQMMEADRASRERRPASFLAGDAPYAATHPNLAMTIAWCSDHFPQSFLAEYAEEATKTNEDRPRAAWYDDIRARFWDYKQKVRLRPPPEPLGDDAAEKAPSRSGRRTGKAARGLTSATTGHATRRR